ncbi:hypothetical protein [Arthrobacter sp. Leaf69]|uniref:hypothetical protein n=1 Tax=Arthrobacter sp. Leaf69 TaxID=1736232 RepID=UPI000B1421E8|nr:hypothetical protein [Arthrobacter sp. Leaf69]
MKTIKEIRNIYEVVRGATRAPIEILRVGDLIGETLTYLLRQIRIELELDGISPWQPTFDLISGLRWHWSQSPGEIRLNLRFGEFLESLERDILRLELMSSNAERIQSVRQLVDKLRSETTAPMAEVLADYLKDGVGTNIAVVLPRNYLVEQYRANLRSAFPGTQILGRTEVKGITPVDQIIYLGAPVLFGSGAWRSPRSEEQVFIMPSWISKPSLPSSELQVAFMNPYTRAVVHRETGTLDLETAGQGDDEVGADFYLEGPRARATEDDSVPLHVDEVWAREVTLSGGHSTLLDVEGEQVRTIDPQGRLGERVKLTDVEEVNVGTYLVVREGASDSDILRELTLQKLGSNGASTLNLHSQWKSLLSLQLRRHGERWVRSRLLHAGMRTIPRVEAWSLDGTFGPRSDTDFKLLMQWLGLDPGDFLDARNQLRSAQSKTTQGIRRQLEAKLSQADMQVLLVQGSLRMNSEISGLASMLACEVLAVSPNVFRVKKHECRSLKLESRYLWLE